MVAGGSLRAIEAILRGDVEHAFHPGGGLHHAMADRASGFCIYNDPALAIALARQAGLRVLYVDLDVHHGDGVQVLHYDDPGVLAFSIHESGRTLFPGTGFADELGEGVAAGTSINLPLEAATGEGPWLAGVRALVPALAAAFGPDLIVSQHGADSHAWDPARPSPGDDDGDGRGGPAGRPGRPSPFRRPLARDRRRRLRRLPGRAPDLGPDLAGGRPSRAPRGDRSRLARSLVGQCRCPWPGSAAFDVRRPAECRSALLRAPGPGRVALPGNDRPGPEPRPAATARRRRGSRLVGSHGGRAGLRAPGRAPRPRPRRRSSRSWTRISSIDSSWPREPCPPPTQLPPGSSCSRRSVMAPGPQAPLRVTGSSASHWSSRRAMATGRTS